MKWHELSKLKNLCAENKFKKKKNRKLNISVQHLTLKRKWK